MDIVAKFSKTEAPCLNKYLVFLVVEVVLPSFTVLTYEINFGKLWICQLFGGWVCCDFVCDTKVTFLCVCGTIGI